VARLAVHRHIHGPFPDREHPMQKSLALIAVLAFAAPLAAQARPQGDPTTQVKGSGKLPDGWQARFDPGRAGTPAHTLEEVNFVTMGSGYHFTSGPAAIYYNPKDMGSGEYLVSATFSQRKSVNHEAYGIFIGGKNLQDSTQTYTYFVIKPCSSRCGTPGAPMGEILISQRTSDGRPAALVPITHDDNVHTDDPADGHATNKIAIHVAKDTVHFLLNDKLVKAIPKSELHGLPTDGQAGIRINHNIDVHVAWNGVSK
jgi:hypothetical protein